MPGRFYLTESTADIADWLGCVRNGLDDPPRLNVSPEEDVLTVTTEGLTHMRWGLIPVGRVNARGRPVMETLINARSETVFEKSAFEGVKRAVVPASGWYEWTGEKRRKQPWRLHLRDGQPIAFAAIYDVWNGPGGIDVPQVATVTCEPNEDVRDIHHRMGVILSPEDVPTWLNGSDEDASALMRPLANGLLKIEKADDVDWAAA